MRTSALSSIFGAAAGPTHLISAPDAATPFSKWSKQLGVSPGYLFAVESRLRDQAILPGLSLMPPARGPCWDGSQQCPI